MSLVTIESALEDLRRAIIDEGPKPRHHRRIIHRHRHQWPTLWLAIDCVIASSRDIIIGYHDWRSTPSDPGVQRTINRLLDEGSLDMTALMSWESLEDGIRNSASRPLLERIADLEQAVEDLTAGETHGTPAVDDSPSDDEIFTDTEQAIMENHECGCTNSDVHGGDVCRRIADAGHSSCLFCAGMGCSE